MGGSYWCEVKVTIPAQWGELVAEIFQEEGAGGVVFDEPAILSERPFADDEIIGGELLGTIPEQFGLRAYFPVDDRLGERLEHLKEKLRAMLDWQPEFLLKQVQEEDWAEAWKAYYKPEKIGQVVIKPSWEDYHPSEDEVIVELDPGMAFGTGTHPTTRLCVRLLQELVHGQTKVLDLGTGTGILAIACAKLGAVEVLATDIDPLAVKIALENSQRNGVAELVTVTQGNLLELPITAKFDLVVANIIANAILELIPGLARVLTPTGFFLASGIIDDRFPEVQKALTDQGFEIVKTEYEEGWVAVVAKISS